MGGHGWKGNLQVMSHDEINVWEWFVDNEPLVRAVVKTACRGCWYLQDELFSEACSRLPDIFDNYDVQHKSGAKISTKVVGDLRWHLWRYMGKRLQSFHVSIDATIDCGFVNDENNALLSVLSIELTQHELDTRDQVQFILGKLIAYDRHILALYHLGENTFDDIANILGCSIGAAHKDYHAALLRAKEVANDMM